MVVEVAVVVDVGKEMTEIARMIIPPNADDIKHAQYKILLRWFLNTLQNRTMSFVHSSTFILLVYLDNQRGNGEGVVLEQSYIIYNTSMMLDIDGINIPI